MPFLLKWQMKRSVKKAWESNKAVQGTYLQYTSYDDHMEQKSSPGNMSVLYDKLYDIIETEDAFYPMIGNNQGYIIEKQNCSAELEEFIRRHKKTGRRKK